MKRKRFTVGLCFNRYKHRNSLCFDRYKHCNSLCFDQLTLLRLTVDFISSLQQHNNTAIQYRWIDNPKVVVNCWKNVKEYEGDGISSLKSWRILSTSQGNSCPLATVDNHSQQYVNHQCRIRRPKNAQMSIQIRS